MNSRKGYAATATRCRGSEGNATDGADLPDALADKGKSHTPAAAAAHCPTNFLRVVRFMRASVPEEFRLTSSHCANLNAFLPGAATTRTVSAPLPQLLPHLDQRLYLPRAGKPAVNQAAIAVGLVVEVPNRAQAKMCQVVSQVPQILFAQDVYLLAIGTPRHGKRY